MKITRIGNTKNIQNKTVSRIEIEIDNVKYTITDYYREGIRINCSGDESAIMVKPGCANEIIVIGT